MATGIPARLTAAQGRKFGLTLGIAFLMIAAISRWRGHDIPPLVAVVLAVVLIFAGLIAPTRLGPVERAWMGFAHAISKVTTPIFMGIVYFMVVAPIGVVMRVLGRNPLRHAEVAGSFWASRSEDDEGRGGLERQF